MKREKIVPVRFSENEYEKMIEMIDDLDERKNVSAFIRNKIFAEQKEKSDHREVLFLLRQVRSEIGHAIKLYQKDFLTEAQVELEKCNEKLDELQKEIMNGGNGS